MTHANDMRTLNRAIYDAIRSGNREGVNTAELRNMAATIDHIIDHGFPPSDCPACQIASASKKESTDA